MTIHRRQFAAGLGFLSLATLARPQPISTTVPKCLEKTSTERTDIDAHCHVFNGSDLQVEKFLVSVVAGEMNPFLRRMVQLLAKPLQRSVWRRAPRAKQEMDKLSRFGRGPDLAKNSAERLAGAYAEAVQETNSNYSEGFAAELKTPEGQQFLEAYGEYLESVAAQNNDAAKAVQVPTGGELERLADPQALIAQLQREKTLSDYSVSSIFSFIRSFYAYRFEHVYYMLQNYGCEHGTVQMIAAALVDYDYPLGAGASPTPSPLPDQFQVMERIAEVFQGRVLTYLPFDPWRVVLEGTSVFKSMQDHIARGAAVGVKLYPPMGFAPLGNADLIRPPHSWPSPQLGFGKKLDAAMTNLWQFVADLDVPVIAHAGMSNAPAVDRIGLGSPDNWRTLFGKFPNARVCFGHFGGEELLESQDQWSQGFLDLVSKYPNAYGDISYFEQVLSRWKITTLRRRLSDFVAAPGDATEKILYGSDWEMLGIESGSHLYFERFEKLLSDSKYFKSGLASKVLGSNAQEFLGLHSKQKTRARLEGFYKAGGVNAGWLQKIK